MRTITIYFDSECIFPDVITVLSSHQKSAEPHTCNCNVWCKLVMGFLDEISNSEKNPNGEGYQFVNPNYKFTG